MDDVEEVPRSLPCSAPEAKVGLPTIVQLDLVDDGLKRNPEPREDFYRQYTPELPTPTEEENLQETKDFAERVAEGLKLFYAGRVLLRREEAEQHGDLDQDQDPDYWQSKADRLQEFGTDCLEEWRKRKKKERKGEAEKGYADALLLSPEQSLSPAPSGRVPSETTQQSKPFATISSGSPNINMHPSRPLARTSQEPLEFTLRYNRDDPPTLPKGQKRKHGEVEDQEQKNLEHTSRSKRQRRGIATTQQKQEPAPDTKSTQRMGRTMPQLPGTKARGRTRRKILSPPPPPSDTLGTNVQNRTGIRPPKQPTEKILSKSYRKNSLLCQPNPGYSSDGTSNVTGRGKSSHTSLREDEGRSLNKTNPRKRQRTGTPNPRPTNKLHSIPTPGEGQGKKGWKVAKARTGGASRLKELQASRVLPWVLRPRDPISYCEVGTRAA